MTLRYQVADLDRASDRAILVGYARANRGDVAGTAACALRSERLDRAAARRLVLKGAMDRSEWNELFRRKAN